VLNSVICIVAPAVQLENIKQLVRVHTIAQHAAQPETGLHVLSKKH